MLFNCSQQPCEKIEAEEASGQTSQPTLWEPPCAHPTSMWTLGKEHHHLGQSTPQLDGTDHYNKFFLKQRAQGKGVLGFTKEAQRATPTKRHMWTLLKSWCEQTIYKKIFFSSFFFLFSFSSWYWHLPSAFFIQLEIILVFDMEREWFFFQLCWHSGTVNNSAGMNQAQNANQRLAAVLPAVDTCLGTGQPRQLSTAGESEWFLFET